MITGTTRNSRLNELRKYTVTSNFADQYVGGGSWSSDGVDYPNSPTIQYVTYYIGGIKFIDETLIDGVTTTFSYNPDNANNFIDEQYIKNPTKEKIISNPKINDDVFIVRSQQSAFEKNYRLEYVQNLVDLTTYAGGKYFNIINNS
jgi:hypothetical protein